VVSSTRSKVVVIGLDGAPYTFLQRMMREGYMPNLSLLAREGDLQPMRSTHPEVSSVAWSSFMTGQNPAKHGIFGFVDRQPGTMKVYIPTSRHMQSKTLWEHLSDAGKRVLVMNVPVTYPPRRVNGILVGDFLSPSLEKATYPPAVAATLKGLGYIIDIDPWEARQNKVQLLQAIGSALAGRERALFHFLDQEPWDYAHCHIMETDRLHHFLWEEMETGDPAYAPHFYAFYRQVDGFLGRLRRRLDPQTTLVILSDHGFCRLRKEVYVNYWLASLGWLRLKPGAKSLEDIEPDSLAYALDPGRIYLNVRGREPFGGVERGAEYDALRERIIAAAVKLSDPESGEPIIRQALKKEDIYRGPLLDQAADIILHAHDGYDLKGAAVKSSLTYKGSELVGMHTYENASLYISGRALRPDPWIADVMPTILQLLGAPQPEGLDGQALF
jgi:predicted AlkP superfamily phosphohydrolase/phosphomutase